MKYTLRSLLTSVFLRAYGVCKKCRLMLAKGKHESPSFSSSIKLYTPWIVQVATSSMVEVSVMTDKPLNIVVVSMSSLEVGRYLVTNLLLATLGWWLSCRPDARHRS